MPVRFLQIVAVVLLVVSTIPLPAAAATPLADAGLDQTVTKGTTVHLDATGSRDPDGQIVEYEWQIRNPSGGTTIPACSSCNRTTFTAETVGTYEVTITVIDDDGESATDTLYVEVEPGDPPSLVLTGPRSLRTGRTGTYVAEATAGDAELDAVVWYVDGTPVSTTAVSGRSATATFDRNYPSAGTHTVAARVVDVDEQSATKTLETTVSAPPPDDTADATTGAGQRGTATISGPRVITGDEPLTGRYSVSGTHVESTTWWKDGARISSGDTASPVFEPGDHALYARVIYSDDTTGIARFADGTTAVVADPRPAIDTYHINGLGGINTSARATDAYGNLRRLEVRLDGDTVLTRSYSRAELRHETAGRTLSIDTIVDGVDPGTYRATLVATDARGQTRKIRRQIDVRGPPELIRSGFSYDAPLESYHPRIDPSRYTATHTVEVKLNGVDPGDIDITQKELNPLTALDNDVCQPGRSVTGDRLIVRSCWGIPGKTPSALTTSLRWTSRERDIPGATDELDVVTSNPEIRLRVISGGAGSRGNEWGLLVDASQSFDPDGGSLIYNWYGGAVGVNSEGTLGKFDSFQTGGLNIQDDESQDAEMQELFTRHFNPRVESVSEVSEGPYLPSESVRFVVSTRPYELPKGNYREDIALELEPSVGRVVDHYVYTGDFSGDVHDTPYEAYVSGGSGNHDRQFWIVEVPAESLQTGSPSFVTFNTFNRRETRDRVQFPSPSVLRQGDTTIPIETVSTKYVVEKPTYTTKETVYPRVRKQLQELGFEVAHALDAGTKWSFERREKVSDAQYETTTKRFDERGDRSIFLDLSDEWSAAGSEVHTNEITEIDYVWRDERAGDGSFTGRTKRVQTQPAEYRTKRQYRYEYTVSKTRSRWVTKTFSYRDRVQYSDVVTRCNRYIGCYRDTVTRSRWVTRTGTRRVKRTYTVRERRTGTYWSTTKRHWSHSFTGRTSTELVQSPEYKTQYEYEVERTKTVQNRVYLANQTRLTDPAVYKWVSYRETKSELLATLLASQSDVRQSGTRAVTEWTLRKQTGSTTRTYRSYPNRSQVTQTHVSISGEVSKAFVDPQSGTVSRIESQFIETEFNVPRYVSTQEAIEIYLRESEGGEE